MNLNWVIIIPARYQSTRFPGKAMVDIAGVPMIGRVYQACIRVHPHVFVATDEQIIYNYIKNIGGHAIMTSTSHQNGTSRCLEAADYLLHEDYQIDVVINVQGDEPFIEEDHILSIVEAFQSDQVSMASLMISLPGTTAMSHTDVCVVADKNNNALYFSRTKIPTLPFNEEVNHEALPRWYKHIGTYGYRLTALREYVTLSPTPLEKIEKLEQLRWLEHGHQIRMVRTSIPSYSIDTPQDLDRLKNMSLYNELL